MFRGRLSLRNRSVDGAPGPGEQALEVLGGIRRRGHLGLGVRDQGPGVLVGTGPMGQEVRR